MFKTFINALKIKEVRNRLLFTIAMVMVIRLGSQMPIPGINREYFPSWFAAMGGAMETFGAFTGGSFESGSIFALNITPYITSSIIMQLLTIAIPKLEEMNKEEDGRKKIASITRFVTVGLAIIEGAALAIKFGGDGLLDAGNYTAINIITIVVALTAGSAFLMWVGERINEKGIGNGISVVLAVNIISRMPADMKGLYNMFVASAANVGKAVLAAVIILAVIILTVVLVVMLNGGVRKIPVQYAKKMQGNRLMGGGSNAHIPMKVNISGVIPIIFASSLMQFPIIISYMLGKNTGTGIGSQILKGLDTSSWFNPEEPVYTWGLLLYVVLVIFFSYFYTSISFNPMLIADNMKKRSGFIPGIRPGRPTTEYLTNVSNYIIFIGAVGLIIVAVIPIIFSGVFGASVTFGGTSLIIVVSVVLETVKQVETLMIERNYKGFLNA